MSSCPDTVSTEIELRLVVADGPNLAVSADLSYAPTDPYAVAVAFHTGSEEVVEWTFARSLLTDGVTHPAGVGDVQVWPTRSRRAPMVCLSLSSPSGRALFHAPMPRVEQFLTETYALVPDGSEGNFIDVDAEFAALLADEV